MRWFLLLFLLTACITTEVSEEYCAQEGESIEKGLCCAGLVPHIKEKTPGAIGVCAKVESIAIADFESQIECRDGCEGYEIHGCFKPIEVDSSYVKLGSCFIEGECEDCRCYCK